MQNGLILNIRKYMKKNTEINPILATIVNSDENITPIDLSNEDKDMHTKMKKRVSARIAAWKDKAIHRKFYQELYLSNVDEEMSCEWIKRGSIFLKTEGFICLQYRIK